MLRASIAVACALLAGAGTAQVVPDIGFRSVGRGAPLVQTLPSMADLPRTPTQKIQKYALRDDGVTADTWDREAAGIRLRRERIG